ncbi:MAG: hypothetical protein IPK76_13115 [Lewinellaceae bacterium]|nr:hypothetical protein [Lewinellaceae bacterium]
MPLEIRELVIKTTVSGEGSTNTQQPGQSDNSGANQEQEIAMIVEKVLQILKEKTER